MSPRKRSLHGPGEQRKAQLVRRIVERRMRAAVVPLDQPRPAPARTTSPPLAETRAIPEEFCNCECHPAHTRLRLRREGARLLEVEDPFFRVHEGVAGSMTQIDGRPY